MCVCDSRQHSLLHDEGKRVEDTLTHLRLQRREEVRDDLRRQGKERGDKEGWTEEGRTWDRLIKMFGLANQTRSCDQSDQYNATHEPLLL